MTGTVPELLDWQWQEIWGTLDQVGVPLDHCHRTTFPADWAGWVADECPGVKWSGAKSEREFYFAIGRYLNTAIRHTPPPPFSVLYSPGATLRVEQKHGLTWEEVTEELTAWARHLGREIQADPYPGAIPFRIPTGDLPDAPLDPEVREEWARRLDELEAHLSGMSEDLRVSMDYIRTSLVEIKLQLDSVSARSAQRSILGFAAQLTMWGVDPSKLTEWMADLFASAPPQIRGG